MPASLWPIITVVGPILLLAALVWAFLRNRSAPRSTEVQADAGAERLRHRIQDEDKAAGNG